MEMILNIVGGLDAARESEPGVGIRTNSVTGFDIRLWSNHDAADTFGLTIAVVASGREMTWRVLAANQVIDIVSLAIAHSERAFGPVVEPTGLVDEIEQFLADGN